MFQQMMHGFTCRGDESDWFMNELMKEQSVATVQIIGYTIHLHSYESNETV